MRYRVDGVLKEAVQLLRWLHDNLVARIKILAGLDISERRLPQDGHLRTDHLPGVYMHLSTLPTYWGEKIALRLLGRNRLRMTLGMLGLRSPLHGRLGVLTRRPEGILLVVGPTDRQWKDHHIVRAGRGDPP